MPYELNTEILMISELPSSKEREKREGKIFTSNLGVVHQLIDPIKRIHDLCTEAAIAGSPSSHPTRSPPIGWRRSLTIRTVDLLADGSQPVYPPRGRDDPATGPGEVEAIVPANAGGGAGDHHDLAIQAPPGGRRPFRHLRRHGWITASSYFFFIVDGRHRQRRASAAVPWKLLDPIPPSC